MLVGLGMGVWYLPEKGSRVQLRRNWVRLMEGGQKGGGGEEEENCRTVEGGN